MRCGLYRHLGQSSQPNGTAKISGSSPEFTAQPPFLQLATSLDADERHRRPSLRLCECCRLKRDTSVFIFTNYLYFPATIRLLATHFLDWVSPRQFQLPHASPLLIIPSPRLIDWNNTISTCQLHLELGGRLQSSQSTC